MAKITVVAKIIAKLDQINSVREHCMSLVGPTLNEPGCINYDLHQDLTNPQIFVFHENWQDEAALDAHSQSAHLQAFRQVADQLVDQWEVLRMKQIS